MHWTSVIITCLLTLFGPYMLMWYWVSSNKPEASMANDEMTGRLLYIFKRGCWYSFWMMVLFAILMVLPFGSLEAYVDFFENCLMLPEVVAEHVFVAGIPEEIIKMLAFFLMITGLRLETTLRAEKLYHIDFILVSVFIGLGFGVIENISYIIGSQTPWITFISRTTVPLITHVGLGVVMGYFLANFMVYKKYINIFYGLVLSIAIHSLFNIAVQTIFMGAHIIVLVGLVYLMDYFENKSISEHDFQ